MLHNDQQGRMQNLASGLTVSRHKGVVVGYLREAIWCENATQESRKGCLCSQLSPISTRRCCLK